MLRLLVACLVLSLSALPALGEAQKKVHIINATPYELLTLGVWYGSDGAEASYIEAGTTATAYVAATSCEVHLTATTGVGKIFSADLDLCRGDTTWVIDSSIPI